MSEDTPGVIIKSDSTEQEVANYIDRQSKQGLASFMYDQHSGEVYMVIGEQGFVKLMNGLYLEIQRAIRQPDGFNLDEVMTSLKIYKEASSLLKLIFNKITKKDIEELKTAQADAVTQKTTQDAINNFARTTLEEVLGKKKSGPTN